MNLSNIWTALPRRVLHILAALVLLVVLGTLMLIRAIAPPSHVVPAAPIAVVEITKTGFIPASLTVKTGTKVVWVNYDQMPHQIAADPYPSHSELSTLFAPKALGYKQTYSYIFTKARTIDYCDQLNPTMQGEIEVDTTIK
jgi:plastocyanin